MDGVSFSIPLFSIFLYLMRYVFFIPYELDVPFVGSIQVDFGLFVFQSENLIGTCSLLTLNILILFYRHYVPGIGPSTSHTLTHLILTIDFLFKMRKPRLG